MGYGLANLIDGGSDSVAEPVATVTLDRLIEQLDVQRVDFIKADIEGYEAEMIHGSRNVLRNFRPAVLLEMDDGFLKRAGSSLGELWNEMCQLGYVPFRENGEQYPANIVPSVDGDVLWVPLEKI